MMSKGSAHRPGLNPQMGKCCEGDWNMTSILDNAIVRILNFLNLVILWLSVFQEIVAEVFRGKIEERQQMQQVLTMTCGDWV